MKKSIKNFNSSIHTPLSSQSFTSSSACLIFHNETIRNTFSLHIHDIAGLIGKSIPSPWKRLALFYSRTVNKKTRYIKTNYPRKLQTYNLYDISRSLITKKSSFTGSSLRKIVPWVERGRYKHHESKSKKNFTFIVLFFFSKK